MINEIMLVPLPRLYSLHVSLSYPRKVWSATSVFMQHAAARMTQQQANLRLLKALDQLLDLPYLDVLLRLVRLWSTHVGGCILRSTGLCKCGRVREMWGVLKKSWE